MKTLALASLMLLALAAPVARAADDVDPCRYGLCLPEPGWFVDGCHVTGIVVTADLPTAGCAPTATVYVCEVGYFGGSGTVWGNLRFWCEPALTFP